MAGSVTAFCDKIDHVLIYHIRNRVNGKIYVGQTRQPLAKRWQTHLTMARKKSGWFLHRAIHKYGVKNFSVIGHGVLFENWLDELEIREIARLDTTNPKHGYNIAPGGGTIPLEASRRGRHIAGAACKARGVGICNPKIGQRGQKRGAPLGGEATLERRIAIHAPGAASRAGHISNHLRYHVRRGFVHPGCDLCVPNPDPIEQEILRWNNLRTHPRMLAKVT